MGAFTSVRSWRTATRSRTTARWGICCARSGATPGGPAHLHFKIEAPGHERLITHVFRNGDPYLQSDAVFGVRATLIADWVRHEPVDGEPYYTLAHDFVLSPVRQRAST